jgi:hypothetical protein
LHKVSRPALRAAVLGAAHWYLADGPAGEVLASLCDISWRIEPPRGWRAVGSSTGLFVAHTDDMGVSRSCELLPDATVTQD